MKKLLTFIFIFSALTAITASADGLNAYTERTENKIAKIEAPVTDGSYPVIIYTPDKKLYSVDIASFADGKTDVDITCPDSDYILKLYAGDKDKDVFCISSAEIKYLPVIEENDTTQPAPDTDKEQPKEEITLPGVYESEYIANSAFTVIKNIEIKLNESDETVALVNAFYQGREINFELPEDFTLKCTEESLEQYDGMYASELKEGDIIYLHCNLSGKILSANLLFRAPQSNVITSDEYDILSKELTNYSCGFGLIVDNYNNNVVTLYDSTGLAENSFEFDLHPETVVYYYDVTKRNNRLSIGTVADFIKSEIPKTDIDDDGNVSYQNPDNIYNYAYARVHDETICDVVIYANYSDNNR